MRINTQDWAHYEYVRPTLVAELKQQFKDKLAKLQVEIIEFNDLSDEKAVDTLRNLRLLLELNWDAIELAIKTNDLQSFCEAAENQVGKIAAAEDVAELKSRIKSLNK